MNAKRRIFRIQTIGSGGDETVCQQNGNVRCKRTYVLRDCSVNLLWTMSKLPSDQQSLRVINQHAGMGHSPVILSLVLRQ